MHTLAADYYCTDRVWQAQKKKLFPRSFQVLPPRLRTSSRWSPYTLLPRCLNAHLLFPPSSMTSTEPPFALSNVCTHRGAVLYDAPFESSKTLRCPYHGRSFNTRGQCLAMPGFESVKNFPQTEDHLPRLPIHRWHFLDFIALTDPLWAFDDWVAPLEERLGFLPLQDFVFSEAHSRSYPLAANWMLYCDNYLEGLHIPYIHPALFKALDFKGYETHNLPCGVLQIGLASEDEVAFDLPPDHPEAGKRVAAFYFWLFPNLMLNFYPWGLSLNRIAPLGLAQTEVEYFVWIHRPELMDAGAGGDIDTTEKEDHSVILSVQQGLQSPLYHRGTYAPEMEKGVRLFHQLLQDIVPENP